MHNGYESELRIVWDGCGKLRGCTAGMRVSYEGWGMVVENEVGGAQRE